MKKLEYTSETDFKEVKYFKVRILEKKFTSLGHYFLICDECCNIYMLSGDLILSEPFYNKMNFIVPKRRKNLFETIKSEVFLEETYFLKLEKEQLSKKFVVSEIFESVKEDE